MDSSVYPGVPETPGGIRWGTVLLVVLGLGLSAAVFLAVRRQEERAMLARFAGVAGPTIAQVQYRVEGALRELHLLGDLLGEPKRARFQNLAQAALVRQPFLKSWLFCPRLPVDQRDQILEIAKLEGITEYRLKTINQVGDIYPVLYQEPSPEKNHLLGVDLAGYPAVRDAMRESADSGNMIATARVQSRNSEMGIFSVFALSPLYRYTVLTPEQRRQNLDAFLVVQIQLDDLVRHLSAPGREGLELAILDLTAPENERVLVDQRGPADPIEHRANLTVLGRRWLVIAQPAPGAWGRHPRSNLSWWLLGGGVLLTLASASIAQGALNQRERLLTLLKLRNEELNSLYAWTRTDQERADLARTDSEKRFVDLFQGLGDAALLISSEGRVVDLNPAARSLLGYTLEDPLTVTDLVPDEDRHWLSSAPHRFVWTGFWMCRDGSQKKLTANAMRGEEGLTLVLKPVVEPIDPHLVESASHTPFASRDFWNLALLAGLPEGIDRPAPTTTKVREELTEWTHAMSPKALARGLSLGCRIDPHVPALVEIDWPRVRFILDELVELALHRAKRGEITIEVIPVVEGLRWSIHATDVGWSHLIPSDRMNAARQVANQLGAGLQVGDKALTFTTSL